MAYLLDPATGVLRFADDAGITDDARRRVGPVARGRARRRAVRAGRRGAADPADRRLPDRSELRPLPGRGPARADARDPFVPRRAADRGRSRVRGDGHLLEPGRRVRRARRRARPGAGRPRRGGDGQRRADRAARRLARRGRAARRRGARPARDRRPDHGRPRPRPRSSSWPSTRPPGSSAPTAPGSTCSTTTARCTGPTTRRPGGGPGSGRSAAAARRRPARGSPAGRSASCSRCSPATT